MGPIAAFSSKKPSVITTAKQPRAWPGGRRLPSAEESTIGLSGTNNELDEWPDGRNAHSHMPGGSSPGRQSHTSAMAALMILEASGDGRTQAQDWIAKDRDPR